MSDAFKERDEATTAEARDRAIDRIQAERQPREAALRPPKDNPYRTEEEREDP